MIRNLFLVFLITFPSISFGQIIFSEIMYDPSSTDTGYEWVEIYNTSGYSQSLENYKFCEGKPVCHSWADNANDNFHIEGNSYAVITDDKEKFLEKNSFDGLIMVSTGFVLTNSGELLQMENAEGLLDDSLTFAPLSGGGDGLSLSVFDGLWKNSEATPGKENIELQVDTSSSSSSSSSSTSETASSSTNDNSDINTSYVEVDDKGDMYLGKKKLRAVIDEVGVIMAGSRTKFTGTAYGITGVEITGIEFLWNFGDGSIGSGQFEHHEYDFPHDYIVSLVVKSGSFTGNTKIRVKVVDPALEILDVKIGDENTKGYISIKNNSEEVLNIEDWMLSVDGERFLIPDNTYIDKNSEAIFPESVTQLYPVDSEKKQSRVAILFPNGEKFFTYDFNAVNAADDLVDESLLIEVVQESEKQEIVVIEKKIAPVVKVVAKKPVVKKKEVFKKVPVIAESDIDQTPAVSALLNNFSGQKANILSSFDSDKNEQDDFIKEQWPFLTFLFVMFTLITFIVYIKKQEEIFSKSQENFPLQNPLEKTEKQIYHEEIKSEADEYEIEEILEK
jgi:hypothetical protein